MINLDQETNQKIEILAPAGSADSLRAGILAGADAVYIGGARFGARAYANNPETGELLQAMDFAHLRGKKVYLTVNTLLKDSELEELADYLGPFYEAGLDAVIVQDFGVLRKISRCFPKLAIHASTQMNLTGSRFLPALKAYHVTRIVPARELSLSELAAIRKETDLELETFVHGALCYCYSGQCLMSSLIGGRSGNRGRCAQPCRMEYTIKESGQKGYWLSPKDICTIPLIPELAEAGINSFKIEGRMKRPEYTALCAHLYRKYTDLYQRIGKEKYLERLSFGELEWEKDKKSLMDLYNRGGFSKGYYIQDPGNDGMSVKRPNHYGLLVGEVTKIRKEGRRNLAEVLLKEAVGPQDILEFRDADGKSLYDYTQKDAVEKGQRMWARFGGGISIPVGASLYRMRNESLLEEIRGRFGEGSELRKILVEGRYEGKLGGALQLELKTKGSVSLSHSAKTSVCIAEASKQPLSSKRLEELLLQTGTSDFTFSKLSGTLEEGAFLPVGSIKELRRRALKELEQKLLAPYRRSYGMQRGKEKDAAFLQKDINQGGSLAEGLEVSQEQEQGERRKYFALRFCTWEQLEAYLSFPAFWKQTRRIDLAGELLRDLDAAKRARKTKVRVFAAFPPIFRKKAIGRFDELSEVLEGMDGFLICNLEELGYLRERYPKKPIAADAMLYCMNREAKKFLEESGVFGTTAPYECKETELRQLLDGSEDLVVYGHLPVMVSAQCLRRTADSCRAMSGQRKQEYITLADRKGKEFLALSVGSFGYQLLLEKEAYSLLTVAERLQELPFGSGRYRIDFTVESGRETRRVMEQWQRAAECGWSNSSVRDENGSDCYHLAHWRRGVE